MAHRNARRTVHARLLIVERLPGGLAQARIAEQLGVSAPRSRSGCDRYEPKACAGLEDRSSRPRDTDPDQRAEVEARCSRPPAAQRGAVFLAGELGLVASTVGRILRPPRRADLAAIDPITGSPVRRARGGRRYERARPGRCSTSTSRNSDGTPTAVGGGCTAATRHRPRPRVRLGYDYLHVAVDDHSRLAYIEALTDEKDATCAAFLHRAASWFHDRGVPSSGS